MPTLQADAQEKKNQKVQNDTYSNQDPVKNPANRQGDPIRNPDPEEKPGIPGNPSQYPTRHPDEIPSIDPNEIPQQGDPKQA